MVVIPIVLLLTLSTWEGNAFGGMASFSLSRRLASSTLSPRQSKLSGKHQDRELSSTDRRSFFQEAISVSACVGMISRPTRAVAEEALQQQQVEMKTFVDPQGLFAVNVPKRFFAIRRSAKGDLPNDKGQGRRGSSIFTAGDMQKAEVIAIERFPTSALLEENGVEVSGSLSTISDIGNPVVIANLIALRRDKEKSGASKARVVKESITVSPNGQELSFTLRTEIEVQRPELLLEQTGTSELFRITSAKASLKSTDGNILAIFASALEADWKTADGAALQSSVDSFEALPPPPT